MKSPATLVVTIAAVLMIVAALSPSLIALSHALVPLVVAVGVVGAILRLVFFHTRRW